MPDRALRRLADLLFVLADEKRWDELKALDVEGSIDVDMSSLVGGGPQTTAAADPVGGSRAGLHAAKKSHHMTTNARVSVDGDRAEVLAQGYAWDRLASRGGSDVGDLPALGAPDRQRLAARRVPVPRHARSGERGRPHAHGVAGPGAAGPLLRE